MTSAVVGLPADTAANEPDRRDVRGRRRSPEPPDMSAFNWIVIERTCPQCHRHGVIKAQCHVASSFDGDDGGRFHDREYRVGERMRWWDRADPRFEAWKDDAKSDTANPDRMVECCYASCSMCNAPLFALVEFEDVTPIAVGDVGLEEDWPAEFPM